QPAPIGLKPPGEHPLRLALLGRDKADDILGKPLRGLVGFDIGDESVLVLVDVDAADPLDRLLDGRHSLLRSRVKAVAGVVGYGRFSVPGAMILRPRRRFPA